MNPDPRPAAPLRAEDRALVVRALATCPSNAARQLFERYEATVAALEAQNAALRAELAQHAAYWAECSGNGPAEAAAALELEMTDGQ